VRLIHAEHAAGRFVREAANRTPQAGQLEIVLMETSEKQVSLRLLQAMENCPNFSALNDGSACLHTNRGA
jgi:hypothetical protein